MSLGSWPPILVSLTRARHQIRRCYNLDLRPEEPCLSEHTNPKSADVRASTASDLGWRPRAGGRFWRADELEVANA